MSLRACKHCGIVYESAITSECLFCRLLKKVKLTKKDNAEKKKTGTKEGASNG